VPAVLERKPRTRPTRRAGARDTGGSWGGGGGGNGGGPHDDGGAEPNREWPLGPAILVVALLAALLTLLGMYTQIQANLTGAQLPGS
jgi:hypothetical protein